MTAASASVVRTGRKRGNGEGSIRQRVDGRYEARLMIDGKSKSVFGKTRKEAAAKLAAVTRDAAVGLPLPNERRTLGAFLHEWLTTVAQQRVRGSTYARYELDVRRIDASLGRQTLARLTSQQVQAFLSGLSAQGLSAATIRHSRAVLRSALVSAENYGYVARNVAAGKRVTTPKPTHKPVTALTPQTARSILDAFKGHTLEGIVTLALTTGLRMGELLGLRWEDVDLDGAELTVRHQLRRVNGSLTMTEPKSAQSRRALALDPRTVDALQAHRVRQLEVRLLAGERWHQTSHVFTSEVGTPLDGMNVLHRFQAQLARAGLPRMRFHDLRHGTASLLLAQGANLREVMEQLGHSQISLTANTYSHISPQLKRDAAKKLGDALWGAS